MTSKLDSRPILVSNIFEDKMLIHSSEGEKNSHGTHLTITFYTHQISSQKTMKHDRIEAYLDLGYTPKNNQSDLAYTPKNNQSAKGRELYYSSKWDQQARYMLKLMGIAIQRNRGTLKFTLSHTDHLMIHISSDIVGNYH